MDTGSLWEIITCIKDSTSPLNWLYVCLGGSDLSKEVLCVFVGQSDAKVKFVKFWGCFHRPGVELNPGGPHAVWLRPSGRILFKSLTLTACNFAASLYIDPHSTYLRDLNLLYKQFFNSQTSIIFNTDFSHSKGPIYIGLTYVTGVCSLFVMAAHCYNDHNLYMQNQTNWGL